MPLIARNGKLLRTPGGLASSLGCCCGDPPPPSCACPPSDCYPVGKRQFSSIKIEVEIDDTWEMFYERDWISCTQCRNQSRYWRAHQCITGLSQLNGTYDAIYYHTPLGGGAYEESDNPQDSPCGIWVFPAIEIEVDAWSKITESWSGGCAPDTDTITYDDTYYCRFDTRSGSVELSSVPGGPALTLFPAYTTPQIGGGALSYPSASWQRTVRRFMCSDPDPYETVDDFQWVPNNYSGGTISRPYSSIQPMAIGEPSSGTATPNATLPDAPLGVMVPHRSTDNCDIGVEEYIFKYSAYSHEWFTSSPKLTCGFSDTGFFEQRSKIHWPEQTWRIKAIFNA